MGETRTRWPQIRAALIALHVVSIVLLSTPSKRVMANKRAWTTPNAEAELEAWTKRLSGWGVETTPHALRNRVFGVALRVGSIRDDLVRPFAWYGRATGAQQGWQMFVRPQKYPAELHVDVRVEDAWQPLVRPRDPSSTWLRRQRRHNRMRKLFGRFARTFYPERYAATARWLARAAARDHRAATAVRVRLYRYRSPSPAEVLAGAEVVGHYEHVLHFDAEALR